MFFFGGVLFTIIGIILVWQSEWFYNNFGSIQWAEEKLGTSGGSRLMYKLVGIAFVLLGFMGLTGLLEGFIAVILSPLTKFMK